VALVGSCLPSSFLVRWGGAHSSLRNRLCARPPSKVHPPLSSATCCPLNGLVYPFPIESHPAHDLLRYHATDSTSLINHSPCASAHAQGERRSLGSVIRVREAGGGEVMGWGGAKGGWLTGHSRVCAAANCVRCTPSPARVIAHRSSTRTPPRRVSALLSTQASRRMQAKEASPPPSRLRSPPFPMRRDPERRNPK
jgi:hypothetical protein